MGSAQTVFLSIIVPCYNEEANIDTLYQRLSPLLDLYSEPGTEVILVDDGSKDRTWQAIQTLCDKDKRVVALRLSRNFGHQMALACGLDHCSGERILIIDADLQDPPELLPDMMAKMNEGFDVVYGRRTLRSQETLFKRFSAWLFYRFINTISDIAIPNDVGDFRLINRRVLEALQSMPERVRFTRGMISWLGFRQTAIDYARAARHSGDTHYSLTAMIRFAIEAMTSFCMHPLRLAIWSGLFLGLLGVGLTGYAIAAGPFSNKMLLVTFLSGIFILFQSIQWVMLGVIGNYLGTLVRETKKRPLYLVAEHRNHHK